MASDTDPLDEKTLSLWCRFFGDSSRRPRLIDRTHSPGSLRLSRRKPRSRCGADVTESRIDAMVGIVCRISCSLPLQA